MLKKIIYNITPFTTTDYKDHLSCIVWFISCNMRCSYCYNKDIVDAKCGEYEVEDLYDFLNRRVGLLDGVVLSGGEATCHNLVDICKKIKKLGFNVKLDTNGSNPKQIKILLDNNLLDFVALDFKSNKKNFQKITKSNLYNNFFKTLRILKDSAIAYEIRTTVHPDLIKEEDINEIISDLKKEGYQGTYYLQNYFHVENTLGRTKEPSYVLNKTLLSKHIPIKFRNS